MTDHDHQFAIAETDDGYAEIMRRATQPSTDCEVYANPFQGIVRVRYADFTTEDPHGGPFVNLTPDDARVLARDLLASADQVEAAERSAAVDREVIQQPPKVVVPKGHPMFGEPGYVGAEDADAWCDDGPPHPPACDCAPGTCEWATHRCICCPCPESGWYHLPIPPEWDGTSPAVVHADRFVPDPNA